MKSIITLLFILLFYNSYAQNDTITIAGDYNYPPFSFLDNDGTPSGYDIDVMNAIADITGLKIKFKLNDWDSTLNLLEKGNADVVTSIVYSASREKIFDFSFPLHTEYYGIFAKKQTLINDVGDLNNKIPAILSGDISNDQFLKPMGLLNDFNLNKSFPDAFKSVDDGKSDYVIAPYSLGMQIIEKNNYRKLEVKGAPIVPSVFCFAVKQGDYELLAYINQGIEILSRNGELDKIYKKWVKHKRDDSVYKKFFYYSIITLSILIAIVIISFLFVYYLRRQVRKKTVEIKKNEAIYQKVFNQVDEGLIILNKNNDIINANKKAAKLFPLNNSDLVGLNIKELSEGADKFKASSIISQIIERKFFFEENIERKREKKTDYATIKGLTFDDERNNYLLVIHDVTKEQDNLQKLTDAKQRVEKANSAKSVFLSTISHEIRTPLFAITGYTNLLLDTELSSRQHDYCKKIAVSGNILINLVNNVLDLTKMEAEKLKLNLQPFNVSEMMHEVVEMEQVKADEKNLEVILDLKMDKFKMLVGDKVLISRIVLNLINNAIKFTNKGYVKVGAYIDKLDTAESVNLIINVQDTGVGMLEKDLYRLFRPFERVGTHAGFNPSGTGLGLALSKQLVEAMGGTISVESSLGKGSQFNVIIQMEVDGSSEAFEQEAEEKQNNKKEIKVLLVEDNEFNSEIILEQFRNTRFNLVRVASGKEALHVLNEQIFDIILMDIEMPEMNGFETMGEINKMGLTIPVVALSAHDLSSEKEKALSIGMVDYLNKPITANQLSNAIQEYCKQKELKTDLDILDKKAGSVYFEDEEAYKRALLRFKKHFNDIGEKMEVEFANQSPKLTDYMHNLKSAAKTIGAIELNKLAQEYEHILREEYAQFTKSDLEIISDKLNKVLESI